MFFNTKTSAKQNLKNIKSNKVQQEMRQNDKSNDNKKKRNCLKILKEKNNFQKFYLLIFQSIRYF